MRKYVRNSIKGKYKLKKKGKRYSAGVGNKATNASLGKKAIVGPVDEEDYHVKRHQSRGIIFEVGTSSTLTGDHGGAVIHGTVPEKTLLQALMLSLVKALMVQRGFIVSRLNDPVIAIGGATTMSFSIQYLTASSNVTLTSTVTIGTDTYLDIAVDLTSRILAITAEDFNKIVKWNTAFITAGGIAAVGLETYIDLSVTKFKIDIASNMLYQNRTLSQEGASGTSNALDVAQEPLFEVVLTGKGTGPIGIPTYSTSNIDWNIDKTSGLLTYDFASDKNLLAEPTKKTFYGVKGVYNTSLNPGVIKQSKLKTHMYISLGALLRYYKNIPTAANFNYNSLGKFRYLWFRKTIDLTGISGETNQFKIAFQHHYAVGATCYPKKDVRTTPFVYQIQ